MSLKIIKHPAERFMDWYPNNTKLYLRGERGADWPKMMALNKELFDDLAPFFEEIARRGLDWTGAPNQGHPPEGDVASVPALPVDEAASRRIDDLVATSDLCGSEQDDEDTWRERPGGDE